MLTNKTALYQLRKTLLEPRVSQEKLAHEAGVSRQWLHLLETGKRGQISYTTANNLLRAINTEREKRNLPVLALDDLKLRIV